MPPATATAAAELATAAGVLDPVAVLPPAPANVVDVVNPADVTEAVALVYSAWLDGGGGAGAPPIVVLAVPYVAVADVMAAG